jgi:hypothetical protein
MARLAIVGAGLSGLAAAWSLRSHPIDITLFEKSRGYSGRAATRGKYGARYDHGANFVTPSSDRVRSLLFEQLPTDSLAQIEGEVWSFDESGRIEKRSASNGSTESWTYERGVSTLGKLLGRRTSAQTLMETRVAQLGRSNGRWRVTDTEAGSHGPFDAVLLTPPAPQTATLLKDTAAALSEGRLTDKVASLADVVDEVRYHAQFAYVFGFDRTIERAGPYHGLLNTDGGHDIAWIGFEHDKPGRASDGENIIVIQMSPDWTRSRVDADPDSFLPAAKEQASDVLGVSLKRPTWYDTQRWRYSMPAEGANVEALADGADAGLFFAGDYVAGVGRIGPAIETGLDAAARIGDHLL